MSIQNRIDAGAKRQRTWKEKSTRSIEDEKKNEEAIVDLDNNFLDEDYFVEEVEEVDDEEGREKQANMLLKEKVRIFVPKLNPSFDMCSVAKDLAFRQANIERINEINGGRSDILYPGSEVTLLEFELNLNEILSRNNVTCECIAVVECLQFSFI